MLGDLYFYFYKRNLFTIISTLSKNEQNFNVGSLKNFNISVLETWNSAILRRKAHETMVAKCELVL